MVLSSPFFYGALFRMQQHFIHEQMEGRLEKELGLVSISCPEDSVFWVKPGKEIVYKNRMFDVKEVVYSNGIAIITGLYDEQEQELHRMMAMQMDEETNPGAGNLLEELFSLFETTLAHHHFQPVAPGILHVPGYYYLHQHLPATYCSVPTPPPLNS